MKTKLIAPMLALVLMATACATFQQNAGKTLATVASTVDLVMRGWATYVVVDGAVSVEKQDKVREAYAKYQISMATAQAAYNGLSTSAGKPAWDQALAVLNASSGSLIQLVNAFMPQKVSVK